MPPNHTTSLILLFLIAVLYTLLSSPLNLTRSPIPLQFSPILQKTPLPSPYSRSMSKRRFHKNVPLSESSSIPLKTIYKSPHILHPEAPYQPIIHLARTRQMRGIIILLIATQNTHSVLLNWCLAALRLDLTNYIIVSLDTATHTFLTFLNAPVIPLHHSSPAKKLTMSEVWLRRTYVAYMLLKSGLSVLISDADAVMLRSPFSGQHSRFADTKLDIISSPANFPNQRKGELPFECTNARRTEPEWRHQICMGWVLLRSSKSMVQLFEKFVLRDVVKYRDDQVAFNCAVRRVGATWQEQNWTAHSSMQTVTTSPKLKILMLPAALYVRNCTRFASERERKYGISAFDESLVQLYHCKGNRKRENALNNGYWFLKDKWESLVSQHAGTFASFLEAVKGRGYVSFSSKREWRPQTTSVDVNNGLRKDIIINPKLLRGRRNIRKS